MNALPPTMFTIGHSNRSLEEFLTLLRQVEVSMLIDVRAFPYSRANPQFNADALTRSLEGAHLRYRHLRSLGGRRQRGAAAAPSPNMLWHHAAFRNYADYAMTPAFRAGLDELVALAYQHRCAIMCAEALWWRCHRRIITDYLLARDIPVAHILGREKIVPATLTPGAERVDDWTIRYPLGKDKTLSGQTSLFVPTRR
jgi:uncharacterized protein (DUF488 family)